MIMEKQIIYRGPGILSTLFIVFLILKLCGVITWSWWWVFSPILIPIALILVILLIIGIMVYVNVK